MTDYAVLGFIGLALACPVAGVVLAFITNDATWLWLCASLVLFMG